MAHEDLWKENITVQMINVSHRHVYLNSKSLVGGAVWRAFGTFRIGSVLQEYIPCPTFPCFLCFSYANEM